MFCLYRHGDEVLMYIYGRSIYYRFVNSFHSLLIFRLLIRITKSGREMEGFSVGGDRRFLFFYLGCIGGA